LHIILLRLLSITNSFANEIMVFMKERLILNFVRALLIRVNYPISFDQNPVNLFSMCKSERWISMEVFSQDVFQKPYWLLRTVEWFNHYC